MSWNKDLIVVFGVGNKPLDELRSMIGYRNFVAGREIDFRSATSGSSFQGIPIGKIDGNLWLTAPSQVSKFYHKTAGVLEKNLIGQFPDSTIMAITEEGTAGTHGLCFIEAGERKRVFIGAEDGLFYAHGAPLAIETDQYQRLKSEMTNEEREELISSLGTSGYEAYLKFESRWRTPLALLQKMLGRTMEDLYDENPGFTEYVRS